ncbi:hypothetical protein [Candidatus Amarobacter glycogenicus]|uniref:hypothetical protein n=1 Tax=Candidatus Amarobacter glycogenicus TaxID=3140699 RepID=UPI0031348DB1|nr:hypothetical protein [Dehalococcoidia bacterium]
MISHWRLTSFRKLTAAALKNNSLLCVGLDPTPEAAPAAFRQAANPILAWNRAIIEATADLACAFKPNIAFYEAWTTAWRLWATCA